MQNPNLMLNFGLQNSIGILLLSWATYYHHCTIPISGNFHIGLIRAPQNAGAL